MIYCKKFVGVRSPFTNSASVLCFKDSIVLFFGNSVFPKSSVLISMFFRCLAICFSALLYFCFVFISICFLKLVKINSITNITSISFFSFAFSKLYVCFVFVAISTLFHLRNSIHLFQKFYFLRGGE